MPRTSAAGTVAGKAESSRWGRTAGESRQQRPRAALKRVWRTAVQSEWVPAVDGVVILDDAKLQFEAESDQPC